MPTPQIHKKLELQRQGLQERLLWPVAANQNWPTSANEDWPAETASEQRDRRGRL